MRPDLKKTSPGRFPDFVRHRLTKRQRKKQHACKKKDKWRNTAKRRTGSGGETHQPPHTGAPLHFQTLIYNFNISNFHSGAHFPNVIFQFMSNSVTIFLNTAYDKLGGTVDMQFRLSVLQAQRQTHAGVCVFVSISVCSVFWGEPLGVPDTRENWSCRQI